MAHGSVRRGQRRWKRLCHVCLGECCGACGGEGWCDETTPPLRLMHGAAAAEATKLMQLHRLFREHHLLPRGGRMEDEPPLWGWLLDFCAAVQGAYAEQELQDAEEKERIEKNMRNRDSR